MSFAVATTKYLEYARLRKRPTSIADDEYRLAAISRARWASKRLSEIKPPDLLGWVEERREGREIERLRKRRKGETPEAFREAPDRKEKRTLSGASPATVNKDLCLISALYRWAIRMGHVDENPARSTGDVPDGG
jgi:hypothetical protein